MSTAKRDESEFIALLYGNFTQTKKDRLRELARQYKDETESYDKTVCIGRTERGIAMPIDAYEHRLINLNALNVLKRLLNDNSDILRKELLWAISRYND